MLWIPMHLGTFQEVFACFVVGVLLSTWVSSKRCLHASIMNSMHIGNPPCALWIWILCWTLIGFWDWHIDWPLWHCMSLNWPVELTLSMAKLTLWMANVNCIAWCLWHAGFMNLRHDDVDFNCWCLHDDVDLNCWCLLHGGFMNLKHDDVDLNCWCMLHAGFMKLKQDDVDLNCWCLLHAGFMNWKHDDVDLNCELNWSYP